MRYRIRLAEGARFELVVDFAKLRQQNCRVCDVPMIVAGVICRSAAGRIASYRVITFDGVAVLMSPATAIALSQIQSAAHATKPLQRDYF
jgi:hypothetical protein